MLTFTLRTFSLILSKLILKYLLFIFVSSNAQAADFSSAAAASSSSHGDFICTLCWENASEASAVFCTNAHQTCETCFLQYCEKGQYENKYLTCWAKNLDQCSACFSCEDIQQHLGNDQFEVLLSKLRARGIDLVENEDSVLTEDKETAFRLFFENACSFSCPNPDCDAPLPEWNGGCAAMECNSCKKSFCIFCLRYYANQSRHSVGHGTPYRHASKHFARTSGNDPSPSEKRIFVYRYLEIRKRFAVLAHQFSTNGKNLSDLKNIIKTAIDNDYFLGLFPLASTEDFLDEVNERLSATEDQKNKKKIIFIVMLEALYRFQTDHHGFNLLKNWLSQKQYKGLNINQQIILDLAGNLYPETEESRVEDATAAARQHFERQYAEIQESLETTRTKKKKLLPIIGGVGVGVGVGIGVASAAAVTSACEIM